MTGDGSKVWCCKEQYCIGTWNVRSMNQGKLEIVTQEMARTNIDRLGISELKWTGMGEFNSDDHYIYYCGQESLRRNGVTIMCQEQELRPWQRSWGRRLGIRKGGIKPQESPWKFLSNLPPKPESAYFLLCAFTYTSDFKEGLSPTTSLWKKH